VRRSSSSRPRSTATRSDKRLTLRAGATGLLAAVASAAAFGVGAAGAAGPSPAIAAVLSDPTVRAGFLLEARARGLEPQVRIGAPATPAELRSTRAVIVSGGGSGLPGPSRPTCVFNHGGAAVVGVTQNVLVDDWGAGFGIGKAAGTWIRTHSGRGRATALLLRDLRASAKERADGIIAGVHVTAPKARVVQAPARTAAEGAARASRGATVVLATAVAPAIGAGQARAARFVGSVGINDRAVQMIESHGPFKVAWSFYGVLSGVRLLDDVARCLAGHHVAPERMLLGGSVSRSNVAAYRNAIAHPLAADSRSFYDRVMRDCTCANG
jgi:hypothetical protein